MLSLILLTIMVWITPTPLWFAITTTVICSIMFIAIIAKAYNNAKMKSFLKGISGLDIKSDKE